MVFLINLARMVALVGDTVIFRCFAVVSRVTARAGIWLVMILKSLLLTAVLT